MVRWICAGVDVGFSSTYPNIRANMPRHDTATEINVADAMTAVDSLVLFVLPSSDTPARARL